MNSDVGGYYFKGLEMGVAFVAVMKVN